jgi:predicted XRE-type DNA-binding protein
MSDEKITIERGSGNVFADLDLPNPEERLAKALLSRLIADSMKARGLTQTQAARVLGTTQPKVSDLVRGNLAGFSMDRLFRYLNALNMNVRIEVSAAPDHEPGRVLVEAN